MGGREVSAGSTRNQQLQAVDGEIRSLRKRLALLEEEREKLLEAFPEGSGGTFAAEADTAKEEGSFSGQEGSEREGAGNAVSGVESEVENLGFGEAGDGVVLPAGLSREDVVRYSRQMLVPSFGVEAQQSLKKGSVLIVGAGGLGSPAALYLAAAGVGRIGIVDRDVVEMSNLHRQIIHSEAKAAAAWQKVDSAADACLQINSSIKVKTHPHGLTPENAASIVSSYSVILDCTDNVTSRYLVNDACVASGKPLVFGAALGTEGQISVYNLNDGPCYRCLFPSPPPPSSCQRCSDSGVLGVVPGVIGILQAVEAIKILTGVGTPLAARMIHFDALEMRFLQVKLRPRSDGCFACGRHPTLMRLFTNQSEETESRSSSSSSSNSNSNSCSCSHQEGDDGTGIHSSGSSGSRQGDTNCARDSSCIERCGVKGAGQLAVDGIDYESFTGTPLHDKGPKLLNLLPPERSISPRSFVADVTSRSYPHILLDVRNEHHFKIASLPTAVNIPLAKLPAKMNELREAVSSGSLPLTAATSAVDKDASSLQGSCSEIRGDGATCASSACGETKSLSEGGERGSGVEEAKKFEKLEESQVGQERDSSYEAMAGSANGMGKGMGGTWSVGASNGGSCLPIFVICRRGNDSQRAVQLLESNGFDAVFNLKGGVNAWRNEVDPSFPVY